MNRLLIAALVTTMIACDKQPETNAAGSASVNASASAPVASTSAAPSAVPMVAAVPKQIPSQADESVAASKEITKANYKSELDKIEKNLAPPK